MIRIDLHFLAGRFHATPWGHHVNEGEPEWPPSPWRLLRGLIASWKSTAPDLSESQIEALFRKLSHPPVYHLPPATVGHTRHYMPQANNSTLLVHDAFVLLERGNDSSRLSILWEGEKLADEERLVLERLLSGLTYFGRAESWCEATFSEEELPPNAAPTSYGLQQQSRGEVTNLLCPDVDVTLPQLMVETSEIQKKGYNRPPGSRWIAYQRDRAALAGSPGKPRRRRAKKHIAVYLIQSRVLPRRTETLHIGDWARKGVNGMYGHLHSRTVSPSFTGKYEGVARQDQHQHAFFIPDSTPTSRVLQHDRIDRLIVWSPDPDGFSENELQTLKALRTFPDLRREGQDGRRFHLVPLALLDNSARVEVFGYSRVWVSATPFLCTRHPKKSGKDSPEGQLRRECEQRGLPVPRIHRIEPDKGQSPWTDFKRRRWRKDAPPDIPHGFRLEFDEPVTGPIILGHSCHFGMGRFRPL